MKIEKIRVWSNDKGKYFYSGEDFNKLPLVDQPIGLLNGGMICPDKIEAALPLTDIKGNTLYDGDVCKSEWGNILCIHWRENYCDWVFTCYCMHRTYRRYNVTKQNITKHRIVRVGSGMELPKSFWEKELTK